MTLILNIPRYVDTFEEEAPIDMVALGAEMKAINEEESKLEQEIYDMLLQLECAEEDKEWLNGVLEVFNHENKPRIRFKGLRKIGNSVSCLILQM